MGVRAMLVEVTIRNFLSLKDVRVKLNKLNVLIGPNASGKSNFIKALNFLSLLSRDSVNNAVGQLGYHSLAEVIYGQDVTRFIGFEVKVVIDNREYHYELHISHDGVVRGERLAVNGKLLLERNEPFKAKFCNANGVYSETLISNATTPLLSYARSSGVHPDVRAFSEYLSHWGFYSFNPEAIRGYADVAYSTRLSRDGGNLAQVLHTLLTTKRRAFEKIESMLKALIPEVEEILLPVTMGPRVSIAIRERCFERPFGFRQISDGTLRLLAFITALNLESPLVAFEEPENCVHPRLLESLIDLARKSDRQVIISTHSPYLLDYVRPEEVLVVMKVKGETKITRLSDTRDIERVKKFLEEGGTLGEAWYSGLISHEEGTGIG